MSLKFISLWLIVFNFYQLFSLELPPLLHPVHVSVVNLNIKEDKTILFSVRLFKDDIEKILNKENKINIKINKEAQLKAIDKYVIAYVYKHFRFQKSLVKSDYHLESMKISDLVVYFYFKIEKTSKTLKTIKVENSLMTDLYQDQTNLFIMNYKGEDFAYSYNNSDRAFTFVLEK